MPLFMIIWLAASAGILLLLVIFQPNRHVSWLAIIALLVAFALWVALPNDSGVSFDTDNDGIPNVERFFDFRYGLDLAGGVKVLMEADLPEDEDLTPGALEEVKRIVEQRIDTTGALEPTIQIQGDRRLLVELPGYEDPDKAVSLIRQTALLEFVDVPAVALEYGLLTYGTPITTSYAVDRGLVEAPEEGEEQDLTNVIYQTVMTGEILLNAGVDLDPATNEPVVVFQLTPEGSSIFGEYTTLHTGEYLGIVLDGILLSAPVISTPITTGTGTIQGSFDLESAQTLATQLRYGALPVPLRVESTSTVGPTLGQVSVAQSVSAGIIGIGVVLVFMIVYYRLPGVAAALALLVFALLNIMVFKLMPVTLTLPAITGFLISVGTAVDGNILIFERMKEELRAGKRLSSAVSAGFDRAWTSIRDSNLSTLIIAAVLYGFGSSFGAGAVRGFAITLALGLTLNLFTAVTVTRTFLHFILKPLPSDVLTKRRWILGL